MSSANATELASREANLIADIEKMLPDFARMCRTPEVPVVIMHQDAFAADYQDEEYRLLGKAIKFAGICGKEGPDHRDEQTHCGSGQDDYPLIVNFLDL